MIHALALLLCLLLMPAPINAEPLPPRQITGTYEVWPAIPSQHLDHPREVIIWLPPGYAENPAARYPVLYMHDGRQVFDPATSTWGRDWRVDDIAQELIPAGKMAPCIVVAADCTEARAAEYAPAERGKDYLRFLIHELKPRIDATYRTDPARNAIAGASMGGLISFYAALAHPDVFQAAACLSPAFIPKYDSTCTALVQSLQNNFPPIRLYLSCGGEGALEQRLLHGTQQMETLLRENGFPATHLVTHYDPAAEHNEEAWSRLVPDFLPFLFPPAE